MLSVFFAASVSNSGLRLPMLLLVFVRFLAFPLFSFLFNLQDEAIVATKLRAKHAETYPKYLFVYRSPDKIQAQCNYTETFGERKNKNVLFHSGATWGADSESEKRKVLLSKPNRRLQL